MKIPLQWLLPLPMKWDIIWACHMMIQTVDAPLTRAVLCQTQLGEAKWKYFWLECIYAMAQEIDNYYRPSFYKILFQQVCLPWFLQYLQCVILKRVFAEPWHQLFTRRAKWGWTIWRPSLWKCFCWKRRGVWLRNCWGVTCCFIKLTQLWFVS